MPTRLYSYKFPLDTRNWKTREGLILEWNDGWGEIAPLPGFSRETLEEARTEILSLLPNLSNAKPTLPSVQFGLACASKPFSLDPIRIPLCALGPKPNFSTVKLKLGHLSLDEALSLVKQHYKNHRLRLDFNRKWSLEQALSFAKHFQPDDFEYLEEPTSDLLTFSKQTHFPIAIDESFFDSPWEQIPSLKAIVVKPTLHGALPKTHLPIVLSSSYESGLGLLHIARLANCSFPIGLDTYDAFQDNLLTITCKDGIFSWQPTPQPINLSKLCLIASVP